MSTRTTEVAISKHYGGNYVTMSTTYNTVLMYNFAANEGFPQRFNIGKCIIDLYL